MTPKQAAFVREFPVDFNATQAAIRAGYSPKTASQIGEQNLRKLEIKEAIDQTTEALIQDRNRLILENLIFWKQVRDDTAEPIFARLKASEYLGRSAAMFTEKVELANRAPIIQLIMPDNGRGPQREKK